MGLHIRDSEMKVWKTFTLERQLEVMINADDLIAARGGQGTICLSDVIASELMGI
ncbi:hypothetical protein COCCU_05190 [Corynebacterium occultum]|uniref:Uncharacterized protein n=1 Tax=Corynebacterium occultum TaxID=2675219 RepID=A0A6B8W0E9_9CORY|nr:hypothetical protein [Corynebacterium occultum]QGU06984.1 hypothetical protein COCCU_05190 [Corynebacterium occultum]